MNVANGILTARGGMTSHAAVVARGMGKCCVIGCGALRDRPEGRRDVQWRRDSYAEGDWVTLTADRRGLRRAHRQPGERSSPASSAS